MSDLEPITRDEVAWSNGDLEPITRKEKYIKHLYDETQEIPDPPQTREEWFIKKAGEEIHDVTIEPLTATQNGVYSESGKAYSPVTVAVPLGSKNITANGTYNASDDNLAGFSQVTVAVEGFKKKSIANTPTDIASFNDGTANPMPSLEISINPVQSGSGDPSPSNVRPISGWGGANVYRRGYNIWDEEWESGSYDDRTGEKILNNSYIRSKNAIKVVPSTMYCATRPDGGLWIGFYDINGVYLSKINTVGGVFTTPNDAYYLRLHTYGSYGTTYNNDISINYPSTDTSYHAYNGSTTSIPFHDNSDNPITVYGGTLNVTSGELTATHANITSYNGETINEPWISSMDVYSAGATPTTGSQVVYPLATPQTYQLAPTQVTTLLGQNNIFADCGQILEGEYFVTL